MKIFRKKTLENGCQQWVGNNAQRFQGKGGKFEYSAVDDHEITAKELKNADFIRGNLCTCIGKQIDWIMMINDRISGINEEIYRLLN